MLDKDAGILLKETYITELNFYQQLFANDASVEFKKFRQFVPQFFFGKAHSKSLGSTPLKSTEDTEGSAQVESIEDTRAGIMVRPSTNVLSRANIKIENLTKNMDPKYTSLMDIKIGTTNVTLKCRAMGGALRKQKKEEGTTTPSHGFNIIGYVIKDKDSGNLVEFFRKPPYKTIEGSIEALKKLFNVHKFSKYNQPTDVPLIANQPE